MVNQIKDRIPDPKRYGEIAAGIEAAWKCRHKVIHSDAFFTFSVLKTFTEAEHEIINILRAMARAFVIFVEEGLKLLPPPKREKEIKTVVPVSNLETKSKIGVDESGKGDLFGPLVVAGVITDPEIEILLVKRGVRDSKSLSDTTILELAPFIKEHCPVEVLILLPPEYNALYEQHGNLNRLLAWGHAQIISKLSKTQKVAKAISDQFGDESLVINALKAENCEIVLEQRPRAESDIAVAAASIIARAEFVISMKDYTSKVGVDIPLGTSAAEAKNIGKQIYRRWGKPGLERIAKMHFNISLANATKSLEGLSVGDAFGELFFRHSPYETTTNDLPQTIWPWTDDTHMALSIVEILKTHQHIDQDELAKAFARRYKKEPDRGYAGGAHRLLNNIAMGANWREISPKLFGNGSFGNGGAMRAAPIGGFFYNDLKRTAMEAELSAEVTHTHIEGKAGAIAVAGAAAIATNKLYPTGNDFLKAVIPYVPEGITKSRIDLAMQIPSDALIDAMQQLGTGEKVSAQDTVPFCLWSAAYHLDNFEDALWWTVKGLGDCDTTCAIVGGIVALSAPKIPEVWLQRREPLKF
jgi:ribonuclease HIII